ncbi:uncharacterized protein LOC101753989 [Setaria italica]|nr:uncharacterized protein LOC101753989 [Setaria italica]
MGCVSSKILAKSGSYQEKGSLGHSFQRSNVIEEIILSSSKSNGDQFLALLCASNSTARKAKEPEQSPAAAVAEPAAKIETINVSELLAGLEEENAVEQSDRKDGDRSPALCISDGAAAGRARSFRTVEEFDALVTQGGSSERAAELEEPRAAAAATADAAESSGGSSRQGDPAGQGEETEAAGARRRARARQLGELKVPAAFDFSKSGSLRDWLRQGGQTFSPGSYVTPKFGTAPEVPAEHGGDQNHGEQQQEHALFDPELVALFERAMEQLSEDGGRVLDEILEARQTIKKDMANTAMAADGEVKNIHTNDSTKTLLKNEALYEYMLNTMVYPRENEHLRELRHITEQHAYGFMLSPPDEEQLLSLLLKVMGARNTIEVGVFTGGSVLAAALAIPDDGRIVAIDVSREYYDLGRPVIEKAGVAHKVDFREGPALGHLDALLADEGNAGAFDFAFVDADKGNYGNYHEQLLRLVRVGGVIAYDNTLWGGSVAMPDDAPLTEKDREVREAIRAFNARIAADTRVEAVQLPVADGITLCRRVV